MEVFCVVTQNYQLLQCSLLFLLHSNLGYLDTFMLELSWYNMLFSHQIFTRNAKKYIYCETAKSVYLIRLFKVLFYNTSKELGIFMPGF
jgi:hypothetical protein